jgi:HEAT repeat protein
MIRKLVPAIAWLALGAAVPAQDRTRAQAERAANAEEVAAKVRAILLSIREDEPVSCEILTKRLVNLGSATTPMLLDALESGVVPKPAGGATKEPEPMDGARTAAAVAALSRRSRGELLQPATKVLERSTSAHTTALIVKLLGAVGDRRELPLLCGTVRPVSSELVDGELCDAFEAAVGEILKRDASAPATAHGLLREQPEAVRWSLIRALAKSGSDTALPILAAELGVHPPDDVFVVEQITQACAAMKTLVPEAVLMTVRAGLRSDQAPRVAKTARCLAAMQDTESIGDLIGLLRHEDPEVRREAHAALVSIANVRLLPDAERWGRWLDAETAWFRDEFPGLSSDLEGKTAIVAVQSIGQMAAHPLHRREIAEVLTSSLEHEPASIRKVACSALRQLGAKSASPCLERWAEDTDPDLAAEARHALSVLVPTGSSRTVPGTAQVATQAPGDSGR